MNETRTALKRRNEIDLSTVGARKKYYQAGFNATDDMVTVYRGDTQSRLDDRAPERVIAYSANEPFMWHADPLGTYDKRDPTEKKPGFGTKRITNPMDKLWGKSNIGTYSDMFSKAGIDTIPISDKTLTSHFPIHHGLASGTKDQSSLSPSELEAWQTERDTMLQAKLIDVTKLGEDVPVFDLKGNIIPGATSSYPSVSTASIALLASDKYQGGRLLQEASQLVAQGWTLIAPDTETRNWWTDNGEHWRTIAGKDGKPVRVKRDQRNPYAYPLSIDTKKLSRDYTSENPEYNPEQESPESIATKRQKFTDMYLNHLQKKGYIDRTKLGTDATNLEFTTDQWDTEFPGMGKLYSSYGAYADELKTNMSDMMLSYLRNDRIPMDRKKKVPGYYLQHFNRPQMRLEDATESGYGTLLRKYSSIQSDTLTLDEQRAARTKFMLEQKEWDCKRLLLVEELTDLKPKNTFLPSQAELEAGWKTATTTWIKELEAKETQGKAQQEEQSK